MTAKLYTFYEVLDVISLEHYTRQPTDIEIAAVALKAARQLITEPHYIKVREELIEEFTQAEFDAVQFLSDKRVEIGEARSSPKKVLAEAGMNSVALEDRAFIVVPKFHKFENGDVKMFAAWISRRISKVNGLSN